MVIACPGPEPKTLRLLCDSDGMRLLLPPSEAKTPGGDAPKPPPPSPLSGPRAQVRTALGELLATPSPGRVLGLPGRSGAADLVADAAAVAGTALHRPALERYCGIVYEGLGASTLSRAARARANESVLIFSGLLGVVRADEPVPAYRLPVAAVLPGIGGLAAFWRPVLATALPDLLEGLVVDLRSTDYAAMWRPTPDVVTVRVLSERPGRAPGIISYPSKLGKGRLARALLTARREPATAADVVTAWRRAGGRSGRVAGNAVDLLL